LSTAPDIATPATLLFGEFKVDLRCGELRKDGTRIKLQEQPFQVLTVLLLHSGEMVSREQLRSAIWSANTFVDFDNSLNTAINKVREALGDSSDRPRFIETVPRRGYRFIAPVTVTDAKETTLNRNWKPAVPIAVVALASVLILAWFWQSRHAPHLLVKHTIVLGDFANSTGDPVFDGTLREGLSVELSQSPFLGLVSEETVSQTLRMMAQKLGVQLTPEITREVCQRTNSTVALNGSIALIGGRYDLVLKAIDCGSGDLLAGAKIQAKDKSQVLEALDKLASQIRNKLGESLATLQKYNTPLSQATTSSLEALQAYTLGDRTEIESGDFAGALPSYPRAVAIDPNFAMAYLALSDAYSDIGESTSQALYMRKAFELRTGVTEWEKLLIEGDYYLYCTGDIVKAQQSFELFAKLYPDSDYAHNLLASFYNMLGQYDTALKEYQQALRLSPLNSVLHRDVVLTYMLLDRVEDAVSAAKHALRLGAGSNLPPILYSLAFYQNDNAEMARQAASATGKPGQEDMVLAMQADTAAYFGHLEKARELSRRAADSADELGEKETAADYYATSALREALFGNRQKATEQAAVARKHARGRDVDYGVALALAYTGHENQARALAEELRKKLPEDTILKTQYLPTLHARIALATFSSKEALEILKVASHYELGLPAYSNYNWPDLYPVYVRGEAYLAARQGDKAAAEFQKILDHRGLVLNEPIGALARLELARAYWIESDTARSRAAYQDFLTLWKDADRDIPILKQAKAEYAKLQ